MVELKTEANNQATIVIGTDVVSEVVNDLAQALEEAQKLGVTRMNIDLKGVQYINSSGLSLLVSTHIRLKKIQGGLDLIHVSQDLYDFFESISLTSAFSIHMDR